MTIPRPSILALCAVSPLLHGCAAQPRAAALPPEAPAPIAPTAAAPISVENVMTPGLVKAYYIGQIIDPSHPELMYRPGVVYREELSPRWNRNPSASGGAFSGVVSGVPDPAHLAPFSAEQQQLIAQQRQALELLSDDNDRLRATVAKQEAAAAPAADTTTLPPEHVPEAPAEQPATAPAIPDAPAPVAPAAAPVAGEQLDFNKCITPNSDGAIILSPELLDQVDRNEPNPFVRRHQLETQFHEVQIALTGTATGPRPSATVNGRIVNNGDLVEGFKVVGIARDSIYLHRGPFLMQIPLARERPVSVRIPQ